MSEYKKNATPAPDTDEMQNSSAPLGLSRRTALKLLSGAGMVGVAKNILGAQLLHAAEPFEEKPNELPDLNRDWSQEIQGNMNEYLDRWLLRIVEKRERLIKEMKRILRSNLEQVYQPYREAFQKEILDFHTVENPLFRGENPSQYRKKGFELVQEIVKKNRILLRIINGILSDPENPFLGEEPQVTLKERLEKIKEKPIQAQIDELSALSDKLTELILVGKDGAPGTGDEQSELAMDLLYVQGLLDEVIRKEASSHATDFSSSQKPGAYRGEREEDTHGTLVYLEGRKPAVTLNPNDFQNPEAILSANPENLWTALANLLIAKGIEESLQQIERYGSLTFNPTATLDFYTEREEINLTALCIEWEISEGTWQARQSAADFEEWLTSELPLYIKQLFEETTEEKRRKFRHTNPIGKEDGHYTGRAHPLVGFTRLILFGGSRKKEYEDIYENRYVEIQLTTEEMWRISQLLPGAYQDPEMIDEVFQILNRREQIGIDDVVPFNPYWGLYADPLLQQTLEGIEELNERGAFPNIGANTSGVQVAAKTSRAQLKPYQTEQRTVRARELRSLEKKDEGLNRWVRILYPKKGIYEAKELKVNDKTVDLISVLGLYGTLDFREALRPLAAFAASSVIIE